MNGPSTPPSAAQIGEYTLLERIAVGGMAEVFRARRGEGASAEVVVLKRILPRVAAEAGGLSRFAEEARLGAYVDHPNVVRLLDAGLHREPPFLALEYVPGCDLWRLTRWLVREGRTLGVPLALHVVEELLRGLEAVHGARDEAGRPLDIVHRDVSPSNVLLSTEGAVKLGDFGIAKATLREERSRASLGAKGKIGYLAPEQVTGERPDQRADVFSAAVILAELLLGRPLFGGGSELAILLAIRDANVQPFLALELEAGLKAAVAAALAKDPAGRPASARAFMEALAPFQREAAPALRLELAGLVATATSVERARRGATDARVTVPAPAPDEPATPRVPEGSSDDARFSATTQRVPTQTYRVSTTDGARLGPWTFAQLVEALTTGRLGLEDEVGLVGRRLAPVRTQPALLRHLPMSTLTPITAASPAPAEPDIRRNLKKGGVVRALAETAVTRRTGLWLCQYGGVRKEIYVREGRPTHVASNLAGEMLGEFLVARGELSRGELDMALAVMPRYEGKLGETLSALGLVEPVRLVRHIEEQVREKLLDLFTWHAGSAEFYAGVDAPDDRFGLDLDAWEILDEGLRRRLQAGLEEERFAAHLLTPLVRVPQLPLALQRGDLPEGLVRLFARVREPVPLHAIVGELAGPGDDANRGYRLVLLGFALDALRWASEP